MVENPVKVVSTAMVEDADGTIRTVILNIPTYEMPLGDRANNGFNIATELIKGSGSNPAELHFYRVEKNGRVVTTYPYANLGANTIEIEMLSATSFRLSALTGAQHYSSAMEFSVESTTDFKISLSWPTGSKGKWIVGEEDSRPAIHEAFAYADINYSASSPKRVRISFEATSNGSGIVKVSGSNTSISGDNKPCTSSSTGVPDNGWGKAFSKACPNSN